MHFIPEAPSPVFKPIPDRRAFQSILEPLHLTPETRYLIYVGGLRPHKNLGFLIEVFCRITDERLLLARRSCWSEIIRTTAYIPAMHARAIKRILDNGRFDVLHFHNVSLLGGPGVLAYGEADQAVYDP